MEILVLSCSILLKVLLVVIALPPLVSLVLPFRHAASFRCFSQFVLSIILTIPNSAVQDAFGMPVDLVLRVLYAYRACSCYFFFRHSSCSCRRALLSCNAQDLHPKRGGITPTPALNSKAGRSLTHSLPESQFPREPNTP